MHGFTGNAWGFQRLPRGAPPRRQTVWCGPRARLPASHPAQQASTAAGGARGTGTVVALGRVGGRRRSPWPCSPAGEGGSGIVASRDVVGAPAQGVRDRAGAPCRRHARHRGRHAAIPCPRPARLLLLPAPSRHPFLHFSCSSSSPSPDTPPHRRGPPITAPSSSSSVPPPPLPGERRLPAKSSLACCC